MVLLPLSTFVVAQDNTEEETIEEVVTTGIKSSLIDAIAIKRNNVGVTEIVTAEDLGKFPDGNIAEALARVSGIAIDRSNVEGKEVSVRGMGAQFNMVTLNGRQMPVAPTEYAGGRSFDFGAISSHGISRLEVYKTQNAALPSGGLGATINMVTAKPLETNNGGAFSALLMDDSTNVNGKIRTPEIEFINNYKSEYNGLAWGVSLSGSYHERSNREETTNEMKWLPSNLNAPTFGPNVTDNSAAGSTNYRPQSYFVKFKDNDRTRKNLAGTFQVAINDVVVTFDAIYSGQEMISSGFEAGSPLDIAYNVPYGAGIGMDNVTIDSNGVVTQLDVVGSGTNFVNNLQWSGDKTSNLSKGLNIDWTVNDALTLTFDAHDSSAQNKGGSNDMGFANGSWSGYGDGQSTANGNPYNQWAELTNVNFIANTTIPVWTPTTSIGFQGDPRTVRDLLGSDMSSTTAHLRNNTKDARLQQYQIKGYWENLGKLDIPYLETLQSVNFGYSTMKQTFTRELRSNTLFAPIQDGAAPGSLIWGPNFWEDSAFNQTSLVGLLGDTSDSTSVPYYMDISFADAVDGYNDGYWADGNASSCDEGVPNCFGDAENGARVDEVTNSMFVEANFAGDYNSMPWKLVASVRYEELELETPQNYQVPTGTFIGTYWWTEGPYFIKGPGFRDVTGNFSSESDVVLPSLAFSMSTSENTVLRFSAGKTIARSGLEKFSPNVVFPEFLNIQNPVHVNTSGNAALKPMVSNNIDLAFEYYYAEGSYAAVNLFTKDLKDFPGSSTVRTTYEGLYDVRYDTNGDQVVPGTNAFGTMDWWVDLRADHQANVAGSTCDGFQADYTQWFFVNDTECVTANSADNSLMQFDVNRPENIFEGTIKGAELAVQHFFVGTNFGAIFNYTFIGGDTEASPDAVRNETFELAGFGDSGNLSFFYENEKVSARISNNYRAETYVGFDEYNPLWVEARTQIDLSATYIVNDKVSVFFEGLNVTDSEVRLFARYENMLFLAQNHGPVYKAGFRVRF